MLDQPSGTELTRKQRTDSLFHSLAPKIPPPPPDASFAKMAAKSPPPEPEPPVPVPEESPVQQEEKPTEPPSIHDKETFPALESSLRGPSTTQDPPTNIGDSGNRDEIKENKGPTELLFCSYIRTHGPILCTSR